MFDKTALKGLFVAIITPFDAKGRIDSKRLEQLVSWQIQQGVDGIVCCGTTGEALSLTVRERKKVTEICVAAARKKPVFVGTGTSDTKESVRLAHSAAQWGADGCLVVTPYYNKPSQEGCFCHFQSISEVGFPMIVYHNPARTALHLELATLGAIAELSSVVGIKESTSDPQNIKKIREVCSLPIFAGEDHLTREMIQEGAIGAISVIGNVVPFSWKSLITASLNGDGQRAAALFDQLSPLCKALFSQTNPQGIKCALALLGHCAPHLRLPLLPPPIGVEEDIKQALMDLHLCPLGKPSSLPLSNSGD